MLQISITLKAWITDILLYRQQFFQSIGTPLDLFTSNNRQLSNYQKI